MSYRLNKEVENERLILYNQGLNDKQIADLTYYTPKVVTQWRRSRGLAPNGRKIPRLTDEENEKRMKLYNLGYGDKRIAKECGVSKGAISQWRWKNNLKSNFKKGQHENE